MSHNIAEPRPHIQEFSDGYWLLDSLRVEPTDVDVPRIQQTLYDDIQDCCVGDAPLLFRHNESQYHFHIYPAEFVQVQTLELPQTMISELNVDYVPIEQQFLVAKPSHADLITDLS
jgi:hypothetical protein